MLSLRDGFMKIYRDYNVPEDLQKHKKIALDLLRNNGQYETAKFVEELFDDKMLQCELFGICKADTRGE